VFLIEAHNREELLCCNICCKQLGEGANKAAALAHQCQRIEIRAMRTRATAYASLSS
jgi:hypothetical protein